MYKLIPPAIDRESHDRVIDPELGNPSPAAG
jgi:hypothetical protein